MTSTTTDVLSTLLHGPTPKGPINPGVANRLRCGGYAEIVYLPSPYKTGKGTIPFLKITEAGRAFLREDVC